MVGGSKSHTGCLLLPFFSVTCLLLQRTTHVMRAISHFVQGGPRFLLPLTISTDTVRTHPSIFRVDIMGSKENKLREVGFTRRCMS